MPRRTATALRWSLGGRAGLVLCLVGLGGSACSDQLVAGTTPIATVPTPACASVAVFGNGARCSAAEDPELAVCGELERPLCAGAGLCFDAPELEACACVGDEDCRTRIDYINAVRQKERKAPLPARCVSGRCEGSY